MEKIECEARIRLLAQHAWDSELQWVHVEAWARNFVGRVVETEEERHHAMFALTRFMYFSKRLLREMLTSLYRDYFRPPIVQRIRRQTRNTTDQSYIDRLYEAELGRTRFIGLGNPAESAAHLLYYFRQVNSLKKDLFVDWFGAFEPVSVGPRIIQHKPRSRHVSRYVFFDDLVGSGDQADKYLGNNLQIIRDNYGPLDIRFLCLFATPAGLARLNRPELFDGKAFCLFDLDDTYKACGASARYFANSPTWFSPAVFAQMADIYGKALQPDMPLGYDDGQLLLGFSHNTPDNTLPIFWDMGIKSPWHAVFPRFNKYYGTI